jgi:hypothetical protein
MRSYAILSFYAEHLSAGDAARSWDLPTTAARKWGLLGTLRQGLSPPNAIGRWSLALRDATSPRKTPPAFKLARKG